MKALLLISFLLIPYLLFVYWKYGMTSSISETYRLTHKWEKVWFTVSMWLVAIPIMVVGFNQSNPHQVLILWLLAGGGICLVGVAPVFWQGGTEHTMHMLGAIGGIACGMLALLLYCFSWLTVVLVGLFAVFAAAQYLWVKLRLKNRTYWIEVAAIVTVQLSLWLV